MLHQVRRVLVSGRHVPTVTYNSEPDVFYVIGPSYCHGPFPQDDVRFTLVCEFKLKQEKVNDEDLRKCAKLADKTFCQR